MSQDLNHTYEKINTDRLKYLKGQCKLAIEYIQGHIVKISGFCDTMISEMEYKLENCEKYDNVSGETYSQKIGYLEGKLMESIGVLDKTILEIISHVKDLEEE